MFLLGTLQSVPESGRAPEPEVEEGSGHGACVEAHSHGQHLSECPGPSAPPLQNNKK